MTDVRGSHLVGSINSPNAEATFRTLADALGSHLRRMPDGEVGERFHWILFQGAVFDAAEGLSRLPGEPVLVAGFDVRPFVVDDGFDPATLSFGPLGYAKAAAESFATFSRLRDEGVIAVGTRFQVSLPTPLGPVSTFVHPDHRAAVEPAYARALMEEVALICEAIPGDDLAIQFDLASEFAFIEGAVLAGGPMVAWFDDPVRGAVERAARIASSVPDDAQLGFHLCYGDVGEKHFVEPTDTTNLVKVANALTEAVTRPINWIHMPVPIGRDDDAYMAPLQELRLDPDTELYLGLIHHEDGVAGARRRIEAASRFVTSFGVATECGFGRGPRERTGPLLRLHAAVAQPW